MSTMAVKQKPEQRSQAPTGQINLLPASAASREQLPINERESSCACGGGCPGCSSENNKHPLQAKLRVDSISHVSGQDANHLEGGNEKFRNADSVKQTASSGDLLPFLGTIQHSFGRHDVSHIRSHTDAKSAVTAYALGAEAFTQGADVSFSRAPSLHTAAHEAAHVIQQGIGVQLSGGMGQQGDRYERHADEVADRVTRGQSSEALLDQMPSVGSSSHSSSVMQFRRIPPNVSALLTATSGSGNGVNFSANAEGVLRLINRAMAELTHAERVSVLRSRRGALTEAEFDALPRRERRIRHVNAILALFPAHESGDPTLLDAGPRPLTSDVANIATVVGHANTIFTAIASGAQDASLTQVFGAGSLVAAKTKYANARTRMNALHTSNHVVTDRGSGFSDEVFEGGLTDSDQISVNPSTIDSPNDNDSITTFIHESMHAGNNDINDNTYINTTGFTDQTEIQKLGNAAHFEVVPWRILAPASDGAYQVLPPTTPRTFQTFVPAGTTVGAITAPARTTSLGAAVAATDRFREAWTMGLNLHRIYVQIFRTPTDWTLPQAALSGIRFDTSIPFWSKVMKMTVHMKTTINPASADPAEHPVSQIDIALSEGLTRKLANGMFLLDALQDDAMVLAFEAANSGTAERSTAFPGGVHGSVNDERDFLLRLATRHTTVAPMTGTVARDLRVITQMGDPTLVLWSDILQARNPTSFAD